MEAQRNVVARLPQHRAVGPVRRFRDAADVGRQRRAWNRYQRREFEPDGVAQRGAQRRRLRELRQRDFDVHLAHRVGHAAVDRAERLVGSNRQVGADRVAPDVGFHQQ